MATLTLRTVLAGACILSLQLIYAQQTATCGTDDVRRELIQQYPQIVAQEEAFNDFAAGYSTTFARSASGAYIIPVVFHVIHDYGAENISDAQIMEAMERINEDFNKENSDLDETVAEFIGIAADIDVEFRLAQRELSGTCTNGIDRIPSMRTYTGGDAAKLGGWQHGFYLNIWVVKFLPGTAAAYAYYPTSIIDLLAPVDGVICRYDYVGSTGAAGEYSAHTLSHEIGHYLNLQHCWGNTNAPGVECGDDNVADTPITKGWSTCNLAGHTCIEPLDNVQNFMEYSYCSTMFTEGQKTRMYAALNSTDAKRNNLWTTETQMLAGVQDGYVPGLCVPQADFYASKRMVCKGESVTFHDVSWKAPVTSRSWTFEGGSPAASTDAEPVVVYDEPGWHLVTLTVSNASGSSTKSFEQYLYVDNSTAQFTGDYFGDFNDADAAQSDWLMTDRYPDDFSWNWRGSQGYYNSGCIWLNSRGAPDQEKDQVISPSFDLSDGLTDNVFFKYATTSSGLDEGDYTMKLKLYYSVNCGFSWVTVGEITGEELVTSYGGSGDFYPAFPDQWRVALFSLPDGAQSENVRFKIEYTNTNFGNNVFIDDFNFTDGTLNVSAAQNEPVLTVFPNPVDAAGQVAVHCNLPYSGKASITIRDITGAVQYVESAQFLPEGNQIWRLPAFNGKLASGMYTIAIMAEHYQASSKMMIQ